MIKMPVGFLQGPNLEAPSPPLSIKNVPFLNGCLADTEFNVGPTCTGISFATCLGCGGP